MAQIIPFPLTSRVAFIWKQAAWSAEQSRSAAERNLERQVQVQRDALRRRGVPSEVVERECRQMEDAIRAAAHRFGGASRG